LRAVDFESEFVGSLRVIKAYYASKLVYIQENL